MNIDGVIESEAARLSQSCADRYYANMMSADDLGKRLYYIGEYKKMAFRAIENMQRLEFGL